MNPRASRPGLASWLPTRFLALALAVFAGVPAAHGCTPTQVGSNPASEPAVAPAAAAPADPHVATLAVEPAAAVASTTRISTAAPGSFTELAPTPHQSDVSRALSMRLQRAHYLRLALDDELSQKLLDHYLEYLDPGRGVLLASDVAEFGAYGTSLDDALKAGDLEPAFQIFNRLLERQLARLQWVVEIVGDEGFPASADLPYGPDEELEVDRREAPWAATMEELDDNWRRRLSSQVIDMRLSDRTDEQIRTQLLERYTNQLRRAGQTTAEDAFMLFMNALTSSYDPHTQYLVPRQAENFEMRMKLSFQGIGALLRPDGEYALVERIIPGGPAERHGELAGGDRIVAVGQDVDGPLVDVLGWRLDDVVDLIRGERGSTVRLGVLPADAPEGTPQITIAIVRDEVKLEEQSASAEIVEVDADGRSLRLGVIDLPAFYMDMEAASRGETEFKSATRDVERHLIELQEQGIDGVILDLRGNGGGSLIEAHELAGLFIGKKPVVQVRGAEDEVQVLDGAAPAVYDGPLLVLVDRLSASASEIVAGAIQDYARGLIVGQRTFGKGTVQSVLPAADGRLLLTVAKFYRVNGASTQNRGVVPDLELPATHDVDLIGESALDGALPWDKIERQYQRRWAQQPMRQVLPTLIARHEERAAHDPDLTRLSQELALLRELRADTTITLDLDARRAEQEQYTARREEILSEWRAAKGLPATADEAETPSVTGEGPIRDIEMPDDDVLVEVEDDVAQPATRQPRVDAWRQEATRILADLIVLEQ